MITVVVKVNCASCDNVEPYEYELHADNKPNLQNIRAVAKAKGWTAVRHNHGVIEDLCPNWSPQKAVL